LGNTAVVCINIANSWCRTYLYIAHTVFNFRSKAIQAKNTHFWRLASTKIWNNYADHYLLFDLSERVVEGCPQNIVSWPPPPSNQHHKCGSKRENQSTSRIFSKRQHDKLIHKAIYNA
jgi:hypothetical protein